MTGGNLWAIFFLSVLWENEAYPHSGDKCVLGSITSSPTFLFVKGRSNKIVLTVEAVKG